MENPQQYVDQATFKWTVGGAFAVLMSLLGVVWRRLNGQEERHDKKADSLAERQHDGDNSLWDAVNSHTRDFQAFKEKTLETFRDVPTKGDLAATEARILAALQGATAGGGRR